jgi:hypothetical protein
MLLLMIHISLEALFDNVVGSIESGASAWAICHTTPATLIFSRRNIDGADLGVRLVLLCCIARQVGRKYKAKTDLHAIPISLRGDHASMRPRLVRCMYSTYVLYCIVKVPILP